MSNDQQSATAAAARVALDRATLQANVERFHAEADGLRVRAHVKAHRTPEVTRRQMSAGAVGIAVHTAAEGLEHLAAGVTDIVIAWPWRDEWRCEPIARLAGTCDTSVHVDTATMAHALSTAATAEGVTVGVRIEIDSGLGRTGVTAGDAVVLADLVGSLPCLRLDGVTGYRGPATPEQVTRRFDMGRELAATLVDAAEGIRTAGHQCPVVSAGGTLTAQGARTVTGVTELCAGAYATQDTGTAGVGACALSDVAVSVTTEPRCEHGNEPLGVEELLTGCHQPWSPDVVATCPDGSPLRLSDLGDDPPPSLLPAHICPLMRKAPPVDVYDGGQWVDRWRSVCPVEAR